MNFFDTSVFVAASLAAHPFHDQCVRRVAQMRKETHCCSTHTLGELFATITRLPRPQRMPPLQAVSIARTLAGHVKCISLTTEEYLRTLEKAALRGLSGAIVYDALLMAAARKAGATHIYTLNPTHLKLVDPELASRVRVP